MRLRRILSSFLLVGVLLGLCGAITPLVNAQQNDVGQGIQVSPVVIDLNGEKGQDYSLKVTVTNITAGSLVLKSSVNDFTADGESGNPKVILDENADNGYSLKSWVSVVPSFTLQSKESRTLTLAITIPIDAEAGGHYGVIRFTGTPPDQSDANVSLNASVGVLLLTRVDGDITENLVVKQMSAQKKGKNSGLIANGPVTIATRVENTGNVHLKPVGTMTIKDTFGKVVGSFPFGSNSQNVLPKTTRLYTQEFDKRWMFGRYTASVQAAYGTTGGVLQGSTTFWVIPFKLIIFVIVLLAIIIFGLRYLIKGHNKRVIRKAQNSNIRKK
ncbi:MAG: hypothetical protein ABIQ89_04385 [Candidatus Saccharimonadales bacterium]